jgi:predicted HAD superfamily Cof-like phosphohydrolase
MIPPRTLNFLQTPQHLRGFRDCPTLNLLPYATYGSARQISLAAEILSNALHWRALHRANLAKVRAAKALAH